MYPPLQNDDSINIVKTFYEKGVHITIDNIINFLLNFTFCSSSTQNIIAIIESQYIPNEIYTITDSQFDLLIRNDVCNVYSYDKIFIALLKNVYLIRNQNNSNHL